MNDTTKASTASTTAAQLRAAANFIDTHTDLPPAAVSIYSSGSTHVAWYLDGDDQLDVARTIRRAIGGTWDKSTSETTLYLRQTRGDLQLTIGVDRNAACVRKVVGQEDVTIPAVKAQPERVEHREIVEWDCQPILAEAVAE